MSNQTSNKPFWVTFILCIFLGPLGAHRFFVGKIGTGILMLVTFGGMGLWLLIDLIILLTGNFKDKQGHLIPMQIDVNVNDKKTTVGINNN